LFGAPDFFCCADPVRDRLALFFRHLTHLGLKMVLHLLLGRRMNDIQSAIGIDVNFVNTRFDDFLDFGISRQQKSIPQKRMGHPVAIEVVDEHADLEIGNSNALDHHN